MIQEDLLIEKGIKRKDGIEIPKNLEGIKRLMLEEKNKQALEKLKRLKRKGVSHSDLFYLLGEVRRRLGSYKKAKEDLLTALRYDSYTPYVLKSLGVVYYALGEYKKAAKVLSSFLKIEVNFIFISFLLKV